MARARRGSIEIDYALTGDLNGAPVMFLPGVLSTRQVWGPVVRRLSGGFPVLLMDNRDSGLSSDSPGSYSIGDLAFDALRVLDHAGIPQAHLAGHSMGGAVAQEMAVLAPDRIASLTLVNTWARTDVYSASVMRLIRLLRDRLPDDREFLRANTFIVNGAAQLRFIAMEDIAQMILTFGPVQSANGLRRNLDATLAFDALERIRAIRCPAAVLWGDEDKVFPPWHAAELRAAIPRAEDFRLSGIGHMAILQAADQVAAAINGMVYRGLPEKLQGPR
jgi:pimeloyl-ACP methyl ester carboxylesterase